LLEVRGLIKLVKLDLVMDSRRDGELNSDGNCWQSTDSCNLLRGVDGIGNCKHFGGPEKGSVFWNGREGVRGSR
jgi:hypothetical protein